MLPLLLYSLGKKTCPTLKLLILEALPMILQVLYPVYKYPGILYVATTPVQPGEENVSTIEVQVLIYSREPLCASTPVQPGEENLSHIEVQVLIYSRHPLCASTPVQPGEENLSHIEIQVLVYSRRPVCCDYSCTAWGRKPVPH